MFGALAGLARFGGLAKAGAAAGALGGIGNRLGAGGGLNFGGSNALQYNPANAGYMPGGPAQQAQFVSAGESKVGRDKEGEESQRDALKRMRQVSDQGYSDVDRAAMASAQNAQRAANQSAQESVLRNAQRRGSSASSGGDLSAALIAGQGSADRLAADTRDINARGQERRIQATGAMNDIGGQLTQQQMNIGQAQNQMNQFNAGQQNNVNLANAGFGNQNQNLQFQTANQSLNNQSDRQQQVNMANTAYNQQMFGQFTRPIFGAWGRAWGQ